MGIVENKLEIARKELLDLSFRNPLLNFKLRKQTGLEFIKINPYDVYEYLVNDERPISITSDNLNKKSRLVSSIDDDELHRRLSKTYRQAKLFIEEKGANTLFLALGFLKWMEDGNYYKSPLILVPVNLKKNETNERYQLEYSYDDVRYNVTLITKMDFLNININYEVEEFDINDYFRFIMNQIESRKYENWEVITDLGALDFFSYGKYLMYQDLDLSNWIKDDKFINDKVINGLLLDGFNDKTVSNDEDINDLIDPKHFYHVVDADSSQQLAIYDVNLGHNLVMQGPPGTGKSQTITNLIANSIALGKTVLFVAEKKAALDVVERRLRSVGLADLVLEMHSDKTNRQNVLKSIENTLSLGEPKVEENIELYEKYNEIKCDLNKYKEAVNKPIGKSKLTPINVFGDLLNLKTELEEENIRLPRVDFTNIDLWTDEEYEKRVDAVSELVNILNVIDKPIKHPFYGVELDKCLPYEQVQIRERINSLSDSLSLLQKASNDLCNALYTKANNIFEMQRLSQSVTGCINYKIDNINSLSYLFSLKKNLINDIIEKGMKAQMFYKTNKKYYTNNAFMLNNFVDLYEKFVNASLFENKKELKKELKKFVKNEKFNRKRLRKLYEYKLIDKYFNDNEMMIKEAFNKAYIGLLESDFDLISRESIIAFEVASYVNSYQFVPFMKEAIMNADIMEKLVLLNEKYCETLEQFISEIKKFVFSTKMNTIKRFGYLKWYLDMPFNEMRKTVNIWSENANKIVEIVDYNVAINKINNLNISQVIDVSEGLKGHYEILTLILKQERLEALLNYAFTESIELKDFKKFNHERQIELFKDLDIKIMMENIKYILHKHYESMPKINENIPSINLLRREFQKKKNQMPIRKLLVSAKDAILKIKPVFMMSPLSIASYLQPGELSFDLVVFDEASQVRPVEAFGALLRSKQIVVVGDSNQLPPTTFFDSLTNKYDELTDEDYDVSNMESILSLLLAKNIPQKTLSWHYRSRHKSLIMISNKEFYDSKLKIFPSVDDLNINEGLIFNYYPDTCYQRGKTRTNPKEAKNVIEHALKHALENPEQSLGIVSFSMAQADELYKQFELAMKKNTNKDIDNYFKSHQNEPFFIKNLENVQGDERDCIYISIGYGYDENKHLTLDFGPLNKEGGERRLNVLITRARIRTEIFTNITGYDINVSKTNSKGVLALKKYLDYAQNRKNFDDSQSFGELCSFLEYLREKLTLYGYNVRKNIGVKGFGIDLAIVDPNNSNRYLLGIECDGGSYGNFNYATDRDRLRMNVLNNLGWKIYHLWTTDFYRNPKTEFEKLLNYIESIINQEVKISSNKKETITVLRKKTTISTNDSMVIPYKMYNGPKRRQSIIDEIDVLKNLIIKIINVEAPINEKDICRRIVSITELGKLTEKAKENIKRAIESINDESILIKEQFFFIKNKKIMIRNRNDLDSIYRRIESICFKEIEEAVYYLIYIGKATTKEEIKSEVAIALGVNKNNQKFLLKTDEALNSLINDKYIYIDNDIIYVNDKMVRENTAYYK